MIWIAIAVTVFFLDFFLKKWADRELAGKPRQKIGKTGFSLKLTHNQGFACNRLEKKPALVKWIHGAVVAFVGVYAFWEVFFEKGKELTALGLAFILGGGISNLYDRIKRGYVVDYLGLPEIPKLLFNLSDLFVFLGAALMFLGELFGDK